MPPPRNPLAGRAAEASRAAGDAQPAQPILPPFTEATAPPKLKLAEEAWNTRDPDLVVLPHAEDSHGATGPSPSARIAVDSLHAGSVAT